MHLICNLFLQTFDSLRWTAVTLQGKCRCSADVLWWATAPAIMSWLGSTRPLRNWTQWTHFSLSILALRCSSAPGIAAMRAWLHCTISVSSATWHWEGGIRWLHYCKCLAPVTHTNTRTHVCAFCTKCTRSRLYKLHAQSGDTDGRSIVVCILLHLVQIIN